MFGKCKIHNVELTLEESREYHGKTYPICLQCRNEFADKFKGSFAVRDTVICAECVHIQCPLREFGLEFNRGCYEGRNMVKEGE